MKQADRQTETEAETETETERVRDFSTNHMPSWAQV